jgi:ribokinase
MMSEIVVVGSMNMDLVVKTERVPAAGETLAGEHFETIPGGKGANQAAAIARLGGSVAMLGCVGKDDFGQNLKSNLERLGVVVDPILTSSDLPTGTATIIVEGDGQNRIIIVAGANAAITSRHIDGIDHLLQSARMLVMQFEIPMPTIEYALNAARARGLQTVLNPAPAYKVSPAFLKKVDHLIVNESEATLLSEIEVHDHDSALKAGRELLGMGCKVVALTLGSKGAMVISADDVIEAPAYDVEVVDTTAAGDAFVGAYAVSVNRGFDLQKTTQFAVAASALAVTKLGAQPSLPTEAAVLEFVNSAPGS